MANRIDLQNTVILGGTLKNYTKERTNHDFVLNQGTRNRAGLTAAAAAMAGSGGAIGLAGMVGTQEIADRVSFEIDGERAEGWLAWSPFEEDDNVEVVAERTENGSYEVFAVLRPADRMISLYPHCSRGRYAHYRMSLFVLCLVFIVTYVGTVTMGAFINYFGYGLTTVEFLKLIVPGGAGLFICLAAIGFNISRKYMPFVRMAEAVFTKLGWKDVQNIDLRKLSKKQRRPKDGPGLGWLYFRY